MLPNFSLPVFIYQYIITQTAVPRTLLLFFLISIVNLFLITWDLGVDPSYFNTSCDLAL